MIRLTACLLVTLLMLTGCAEWVNIPAVPGDAARHDPNLKDVADVEVAAISAVLTRFPTEGSTQIILPMGTSDTTYQRVVQSVGQGAVIGNPSADSSLEITAVRIRVTEAWVDIRRLTDTRVPQLYTVYLRNDVISGWYMQRIRPWRGTINDGDHVPAKLQEERALYDSELSQPAAPQTVAMPEARPTPQSMTVETAPDSTATTTSTTVIVAESDVEAPVEDEPVTSQRTMPQDVQIQSGGVIEITE